MLSVSLRRQNARRQVVSERKSTRRNESAERGQDPGNVQLVSLVRRLVSTMSHWPVVVVILAPCGRESSYIAASSRTPHETDDATDGEDRTPRRDSAWWSLDSAVDNGGRRRLRRPGSGGACGWSQDALSRSGRVQLVAGRAGVHARSALVRVSLFQPHHLLQRTAARALVADTVVAVLPTDGPYRRDEQVESRTQVRRRQVGQRRGWLGNRGQGLGGRTHLRTDDHWTDPRKCQITVFSFLDRSLSLNLLTNTAGLTDSFYNQCN